MSLIKCANCEKKINFDSKFCQYCGVPLKGKRNIIIMIGVFVGLIFLLGFIIISLINSSSMDVIGNWYYYHYSSVNYGKTETTFHINRDHTCSYDMVYTLYGSKIVDTTSYCTWKVDGKYIVYDTNGKRLKLFYDREEDCLYTLNNDTLELEWKFERK